MAIPVIADVSKRMSRDFGVLIDDAADGDDGVALRGTFIIDPKGTVRSLQINDLPVGRSVDEVLRLVQAFQSNERDGGAYASLLRARLPLRRCDMRATAITQCRSLPCQLAQGLQDNEGRPS